MKMSPFQTESTAKNYVLVHRLWWIQDIIKTLQVKHAVEDDFLKWLFCPHQEGLLNLIRRHDAAPLIDPVMSCCGSVLGKTCWFSFYWNPESAYTDTFVPRDTFVVNLIVIEWFWLWKICSLPFKAHSRLSLCTLAGYVLQIQRLWLACPLSCTVKYFYIYNG